MLGNPTMETRTEKPGFGGFFYRLCCVPHIHTIAGPTKEKEPGGALGIQAPFNHLDRKTYAVTFARLQKRMS